MDRFAIRRIDQNRLTEFTYGGLWIIGPARSGKSALIKSALNELRTKQNTRVVILSTDFQQSKELYHSGDLDFGSLNATELNQWANEGSQWLWLSRTDSLEDFSDLKTDVINNSYGEVIIQNVRQVLSACQVAGANYRTIFVIDEIHPVLELVYNITNSMPHMGLFALPPETSQSR